MKKRLLSILLTVCLVMTLLPTFTITAMAATAYSSGLPAGTSGAPLTYTISNETQLRALAAAVNSGTRYEYTTFVLQNDITLTGGAWTPISNDSYYKPFSGTFDGAGHTISGLTGSLFGYIYHATIKNVGLLNVNITAGVDCSGYQVAGLVAFNEYSTVQNCYTTGNFNVTYNSAASFHLGGIVASNAGGTVQNCYSTATIIVGTIYGGSVNFETISGGIVGDNYSGGTVQNCYSKGLLIVNTDKPAAKYVGGIVGINRDSSSRVKNGYWLSGSPSLGIGNNGGTGNVTNVVDFDSYSGGTFSTACNVNGDNTYTGSSLVEALNAWVNSVASTDLKTWTSSGSLPVFSAPWAPPTYSATVTVNKDGSAWSGSGKSLALYQNSTNKYSLTLSGSSATVSALAGTYDIYDGASDTGVDLVVSSGGGNAATVNYYTLDLAAGTGTSLPNGSGVYLLGKNVPINVTVNTGYQWSKWTSSNTAKLWDQTAKSISITMPDAPITLTATSVPIQYTIGYSLNGGTVSTANPASYTVESSVISLNAPTRSGYSFLGWTGSNGTTAQTNVSIPAGSTENKTYTANWTTDTYTIGYSLNGGTISTANSASYTVESSVISLNAPTRSGYSFLGWTGSNGTTAQTNVSIPAGSTGNKTYTANWTTDTYVIGYSLNGGTISTANSASYTVESSLISLNPPTRSGYSFLGWTGSNGETAQINVSIPTGSTGNKTYIANWKADKPASAPDASIVMEKTDASITIATQEGYEYSVDGTNWCSGTGSYIFNGLAPDTAYNLVCRKATVATGNTSAASDASEALSVSTKKASASVSVPAAPTIGTGADRPTSDTITINTVEGNEYYISTSSTAPATWPSSGSDYFKATGTDGHTFTGLNAGTQYYIHVRVAETDGAMPSASAYVTQYTLPETPAASAVTINYSAETINFANTYEVSTSSDFAATIASGDTLQPGTTYYVRVKAAGGAPASESTSFTVSARPDAPSAGAYSYDYENEQIIFGGSYEVYTANDGTGSAVESNSTILTPGSTLYIRVKATSSAPASGWAAINVPERQGTAGLSIYAISSDTTITVTEITGAEYSRNGGSTWQSSNQFTGLDADNDYDITIRYAAAGTFASDALSSVTVRTKTSASDAPVVPSVSEQTDHAITIDAVAGCQYTITTSDTEPTTWGAAETTTGTKTFTSLSAATRYYIWVRVAETATAMPSDASRIRVYTAAAVPSAEGYTIDYSAETISYDDGIYEVTADTVAFPLIIIGDGDSITNNISDYGDAAQKIYVRVKAIEDGAPAGAWMEVTLPARPVTASASASNETADNKNDGRISGVTEAMEWKIEDGAYAAVTADQASNGISGLSDGTYYVRYMAVSGTGFKSDEQIITIAAGNTITVTFNSQSGSAVDPITGKAYGDSITAPADPTRSGFYFAGWYKEASYTNPWTFTLDTLTGNITLFAKWSAIPTYTVTGKIVDDDSLAVDGATVRMMKGATQFGTTVITDSYGDFAIDKVPQGIYNLVITKGTKKAIVKVQVSSENVAIGNATLPSGNANSVLVVSGSDTPKVVVEGLNSEAGLQLLDSGNPLNNVEITLTVEEKDAATAANGSEVTGTATAAGKQVGMILTIDLRKTVNGTEDASYNQTDEMIEINIPLPAQLQGKSTYAIYRYHGTGVDLITETPNDDLERIVVDRTNWTITLYANKFSTYAIGYTNPSGRGGSAASTGTTAASIESQKTSALPYYIENGKEVFIGLSKDASGTMKYIAPEGVTVLFRENPKSFNDIAGHWAKDNIAYVTQRELFLGTGDGSFSPQSGMTRAMFATVIGRLYERSYGEVSQKDDFSFSDVDSDAYYRAYIDWASENKIITGTGDGLFKPDQEITRQEMAAILYRFAEFLDVLSLDSEKTQLNYPDAAEISSWATEAAEYCQQTGIITGRSGGDFVPQGTATRAEVAAILQRFIENTVK